MRSKLCARSIRIFLSVRSCIVPYGSSFSTPVQLCVDCFWNEMASAHDVWEDKLQDPNATPMSLPLEFLKAITRDFSTDLLLGEGGFGAVYKGVLRSGETIAVKKLFEAHLKEETFQNEVRYLMGIKHQNVVQFVGYCSESSWELKENPSGRGKHIVAEIPKRLLCFEHIHNKSLDKHISDESSGLEWNIRYDIIKGICTGLHFLHEECRMVHLVLKPENILMDSTMMPKIADFGLSRIFGEQQTRIVTNSRAGTRGYMAPEYLIQGVVSKKADIFSLGVIFIEIITGGRNYPYFHQDNPHRDDTSFRQFTEEVIGRWRNKFTSIPKYKLMEKYTQQVKQCVTIALKCVDPSMEKRPTAKDIMQVLNAVDQLRVDGFSNEIASTHDVWEDKLHDPNATPMSLPLDFLKAITRDFSTELVLGAGGFGEVYKGVLRSGEAIAVKKLFEAHLKEETFENEVCYLMGIKHENVVRFVGYCAESRWEAIEQPSGSGKHILAEMPKRLLCFEYVSNKSLDKHISDESSGLEWNMRYDIIKGICNGLHLLHEECCMVHLDLKPENILMDSTMMPKIADFGLSRIFSEQQTRIVTNNRAGTCGYMAPEYLIQGVVSKKADIFSLGVIFIEIITGGRNYPYPHRDDTSLRQFTEEVIGRWRNKFTSIPKYKSMEKYTQQVKQCVTIALKCVDPSMEKRPTAKDIMQVLNAIDQYDDCIEDCDMTVERGRELADFKIISRALTRKGTALTKHAKCSKDYDVAIETFQTALTQHRNPDTLKRLNDAERAKKELEQQEYYDPKIADEEREKGNEFFRQQQYPEAVKHYTEALRRNPKDPKIYSNRAACYTKLDAMPEGLKDTEKCIELDPTFSKGYTRKGAIQFFLKDYDKAMETYRAGLKHDPSNQEMLDGVERCIQQKLTLEEKQEKKIIDDVAGQIFSLDANQIESLIITGHRNGYVQIWNYDTQKVVGLTKFSAAVTNVKFIARKGWFVAMLFDSSVHVYNYEKEMQKVTSFKAHNRPLFDRSLAVHPTQSYVLSGCGKKIMLWDWDQGWNRIQTFEAHSDDVSALKFNPEDTNCFASASLDSTVKVWSIDSPKSKYTLSGHSHVVNFLDFFMRDGQQYLISGSYDNTAKIWDMQECIHTLKHESAVLSVFSHPSLPVLITGTNEGAVRVWSSTNFRLKTKLNMGDDASVRGFACLMGSGRVAVAHPERVSVIDFRDEEEQGGINGNDDNSISATLLGL